jgi:hypothetical protein
MENSMPTPKEDFEGFAITLLLCTPSELNRLWTKEGVKAEPEKVKAYLDSLGLSAGGRRHADDLIKKLDVARFVFKAVAESLVEFSILYSGGYPHPSPGDAKAIVKALQGIGG